jgi:hypothetical protein
MYNNCPECGHQRQSEDESNSAQCPACGLVFKKWLKAQLAPHVETPQVVHTSYDSSIAWHRLLIKFFFPPRKKPKQLEFAFYVGVFLILLVWGFYFLSLDYRTNEIGNSFLHNVDLVFHEAGHVFFQIFGRFMMFLGGSLFQVLLPLLLTGAFLIVNKDGFAASVCLWWAGQSLMDLAPYIGDARALRLPLLGGGTGADVPGMHDWANILRQLGWLAYDQQIARGVDLIGSAVMILALVWGAIMLKNYYKSLGAIAN